MPKYFSVARPSPFVNPNFICQWMMLKLYKYDYHIATIVIVVGWLDKTLVCLLNC